MTANLNKAIVLGQLGADPIRREFQGGGAVVNFDLATSEYWKDAGTGERRSATEWHRIVIFNEALGEIAMKHLRKGSAVYIEGRIQSRKYRDNQGNERRVSEIVLPRHRGELKLMDPRDRDGGGGAGSAAGGDSDRSAAPPVDDEIPF